jgi:hypothetical protein
MTKTISEVLDDQYNFDNDKKMSDHTSKKSWWIIGFILGLFTNFVAFLIFHMFHIREHGGKQQFNDNYI